MSRKTTFARQDYEFNLRKVNDAEKQICRKYAKLIHEKIITNRTQVINSIQRNINTKGVSEEYKQSQIDIYNNIDVIFQQENICPDICISVISDECLTYINNAFSQLQGEIKNVRRRYKLQKQRPVYGCKKKNKCYVQPIKKCIDLLNEIYKRNQISKNSTKDVFVRKNCVMMGSILNVLNSYKSK